MLAVEMAGGILTILGWRTFNRLQRTVGVWLGVSGLFTIASILTARLLHNSQPASNLSHAASLAIGLMALSEAYGARRARFLFITAGISIAVLSAVLLVTAERLDEYSKYSAPVEAMALAAGAGITIVHRSTAARRDLRGDRGFLTAIAFFLYSMASAFLTTVAQLWMREYPRSVLTYYGVRHTIVIGAFLVMVMTLKRPAALLRLSNS